MLRRTKIYAAWLFVVVAVGSTAKAADEEAKCNPTERTGVVYEGSKLKRVTFRCARREAVGIKLTCDSGEFVMGFYCRLHGSSSGVYTALVSAGIIGRRSGACVWSSKSDVSITLRCKGTSPLKNDAKSDEYNE
jgi:hypothetical protein